MSKTKTKCALRIFVCRNVHMYWHVYCLCTWELCVVSFKKIYHSARRDSTDSYDVIALLLLFVRKCTYIHMYVLCFLPLFSKQQTHILRFEQATFLNVEYITILFYISKYFIRVQNILIIHYLSVRLTVYM